MLFRSLAVFEESLAPVLAAPMLILTIVLSFFSSSTAEALPFLDSYAGVLEFRCCSRLFRVCL